MTDFANSLTREPLRLTLDMDRDTLELFGVKYALTLFRLLAFAPVGAMLEIIDRDDGTVSLRHIPGPRPDPDPEPEPVRQRWLPPHSWPDGVPLPPPPPKEEREP